MVGKFCIMRQSKRLRKMGKVFRRSPRALMQPSLTLSDAAGRMNVIAGHVRRRALTFLDFREGSANLPPPRDCQGDESRMPLVHGLGRAAVG